MIKKQKNTKIYKLYEKIIKKRIQIKNVQSIKNTNPRQNARSA